MKILLFIVVSFFSKSVLSQSQDEISIRKILTDQNNAWNNGNIEAFMNGYWKNDSLKFIGKSGITYGWDKTLNNYKKSYPDSVSMGKLTFDISEVTPLSEQYYFVIGKWFLKRSISDVGGHFTLIFRKIDAKWVIVADHSS